MSAGGLLAAEVDESRLPPPASALIDFTRDIKPIFDTACIRCHGPERPKSRFRLDNREAALKGGENGVDILPGNSAKSPLIHYVARLVVDMEMPPDGKGDPLTKDQIALLRAWIDQGANWETVGPTNLVDLTFTLGGGWTLVNGDTQKYREHYWKRDGFTSGLENFEFVDRTQPDTTVTLFGHAVPDDYLAGMKLDWNDIGFFHARWEQYRKYYDDTGGFYPPRPPQSLDEDLHLDLGKAAFDFGLRLPNFPRLTFGYEYLYRRGEEATTSWGSDGGVGPFGIDPRNIAPTTRHIEEGTHVIKFDLETELKGFTIEDQFRGEFYTLSTHYTNLASRSSIAQNASEDNRSFQGANSIRVEKKFKDWLFGSAGYFYSKLNADDSFTNATTANGTVYLATVPRIELSRETHMGNLNGLIGPFAGLTLSAGAQSEWTHDHGVGSGDLNGIAYTRPPGSNLQINPATLFGDYDQTTVSEWVGLRFAKIPFTSLFADGRLQQQRISQAEADFQPNASQSFLENPTYSSDLTDVRAGFSTSPWQNASLSAHYRYYENDTHYDTNAIPQPPGGYPGFIASRDLVENEVEAKLVLRPLHWLKTTLSYQYVKTDYNQNNRPAVDPFLGIVSPGGYILAGKSDSHIYSFGATATPLRQFLLSGTFSFQDSSTITPSGGFVPQYTGHTYSALLSGTYIINEATDLGLTYSFSMSDYSQYEFPIDPRSPPPLGIRYQQHGVQATLTRRVNKYLTTRLQYGFFYYDEPTLANVNDYKAHTVLATLTYHFH